jgi:hypothetical protein
MNRTLRYARPLVLAALIVVLVGSMVSAHGASAAPVPPGVGQSAAFQEGEDARATRVARARATRQARATATARARARATQASGGSRTSRGGNVGKVTGTGIGTTATVADNMGVMLLLGGSVLFAAGGVYALRRRPA